MQIPEFATRIAIPSDADDIASAHRDSIRSIGPTFYAASVVDDWEEGLTGDVYLNAMAAGEVFFIARGKMDGMTTVLGFSSDYRKEGSTHGTSVYVRGAAARHGVGSALYRLAEAHARVHGATCIEIEASLAGVDFYKVNGFLEVGGGEIRLRSGHPISCVFMRKNLSAASPAGR